jgi:UDP-N-acetylmuramate dehydrogenase
VRGIEADVMDEVDTEHWVVQCGAGERWDDVVAWCVEHECYGAENLSLIPGDVGASVVQNIGAYGVEVKDLMLMIEAVEIESGEVVVFGRADCQYGYRQSRFKQDWKNKYLITRVLFLMERQFTPQLDYGNVRQALEQKGITEPSAAEMRQVVIDIRREKLPDPDVCGNAGSFFMNPVVERSVYEKLAAQYPEMPHYTVDEEHEKIPAGWMIDQCGWKGKTLGRAGVYDKQALVLVNLGGASGADILQLCQTICKDVYNRFGIELHPEVNIV